MNPYENGVIKYQISLERYKNGIANDVIQLLDNANIEIAGYIKKTQNVATKGSYQQIAKKLRFPVEKLKISGDVLGNSSSATVPTTIAYTNARGRLLVSGFGGGLSASVGLINISDDCKLKVVDL